VADLNALLTLNRTASGAITAYRIVKPAGDGKVAQCSAKADAAVGVAGIVGAADKGRIDINFAGVVPVEYGGAVSAGDLLMSDAQGRAVVADDTCRVIGVANEDGSGAGVIGSMLIAPSSIPAP
jgi:hypothetical protein